MTKRYSSLPYDLGDEDIINYSDSYQNENDALLPPSPQDGQPSIIFNDGSKNRNQISSPANETIRPQKVIKYTTIHYYFTQSITIYRMF